jgi:hypothetical protein
VTRSRSLACAAGNGRRYERGVRERQWIDTESGEKINEIGRERPAEDIIYVYWEGKVLKYMYPTSPDLRKTQCQRERKGKGTQLVYDCIENSQNAGEMCSAWYMSGHVRLQLTRTFRQGLL